MPQVLGQNSATPRTTLQNDNLVPKFHLVQSSAAANTVVAQMPAADPRSPPAPPSLCPLGAPTRSPCPTWPATPRSRPASALGSPGLTVGTQTQQCSNTIGNGLVVSTNPAAGTAVPKNTPVNLVISTGPCSMVVQNVLGRPSDRHQRPAGPGPDGHPDHHHQLRSLPGRLGGDPEPDRRDHGGQPVQRDHHRLQRRPDHDHHRSDLDDDHVVVVDDQLDHHRYDPVAPRPAAPAVL